jgi:hypothetical protein
VIFYLFSFRLDATFLDSNKISCESAFILKANKVCPADPPSGAQNVDLDNPLVSLRAAKTFKSLDHKLFLSLYRKELANISG